MTQENIHIPRSLRSSELREALQSLELVSSVVVDRAQVVTAEWVSLEVAFVVVVVLVDS